METVAEQVAPEVKPAKRLRGRPVNPDSVRQQKLRAAAEKAAKQSAE